MQINRVGVYLFEIRRELALAPLRWNSRLEIFAPSPFFKYFLRVSEAHFSTDALTDSSGEYLSKALLLIWIKFSAICFSAGVILKIVLRNALNSFLALSLLTYRVRNWGTLRELWNKKNLVNYQKKNYKAHLFYWKWQLFY